MYVTGITEPSPSVSIRSSQQSSTSPVGAMSAIEHPALMFGSTTRWCSPPSTAAVSAMKCTPQKMTKFDSCRSAAYCDSFSESPRKSANWMMSSRW